MLYSSSAIRHKVLFHFLLLSTAITNGAEVSSKYVIGAWPSGGLGACLNAVLQHLLYCEQNNKTPVIYWGQDSTYYCEDGFNDSYNVWEYYFEPISDLKYEQGDSINNFCSKPPIIFAYYNCEVNAVIAGSLFKKYVKIKPSIQKKIDDFYNLYMKNKKTIGIHIRGTDKFTEEKPIDPERMATEALKYADKDTQFLIASDERKIIDDLTNFLGEERVIYYDCMRSLNNKPLHYRSYPCFAQNGEDVLVEMALLSKCDFFLRTLSSVSAVVLYFNPLLPCVTLK